MDKGVVKRVIVTPDKHFPLHDQPSINCLKKTIEIVKPDAYIDLGDVGEWHAFSAWRFKRKKAPPLEYLIDDFDKDVKDVNSGMDQIDESLDKANCTEKYFTEGNHDNWCNMAVENIPIYLSINLLMLLTFLVVGINTSSLGSILKWENFTSIMAINMVVNIILLITLENLGVI